MDPALGKAEPINDVVNTSGITCLRRGEKKPTKPNQNQNKKIAELQLGESSENMWDVFISYYPTRIWLAVN